MAAKPLNFEIFKMLVALKIGNDGGSRFAIGLTYTKTSAETSKNTFRNLRLHFQKIITRSKFRILD